jgi:uncharacterized protein (DUF58 family)
MSAGSPGAYRLHLRNEGAAALPPLVLVESLQQPWPSAAALGAQRGAHPDEFAAGAFDRRLGYPVFLELLRRLRVLDIGRLDVPALLPGQRHVIVVETVPGGRGIAAFEELLLLVAGPLGLVQAPRALPIAPAKLPVLPRRLACAPPPALAARQLQAGGVAQAQHVGDAEEFRSLRDYRPGDPLRSIHWRSFARLGRPIVREYQEEYFARQALVLDCAADDPLAPAFEHAIGLAAGLVARPRDSDSLLDLIFVAGRVHRASAGRGLGDDEALLRVLAGLRPAPEAATAALLANVEAHAGQVSSLIMILLGWDSQRRDAVRRLRRRGLNLWVVLVDASGVAAADAALIDHIAAPAAVP